MSRYPIHSHPTRRTHYKKKSNRKYVLYFFLIILLLTAIIFGFYKITPQIAKLSDNIKRPNWTYFQVQDITVNGTNDETALNIIGDISYNEDGTITYKDVIRIKRELKAKYPNFENVEVSRNYLTKKLNIKVKNRKPIAKMCDEDVCHYIDGNGFVYKDDILENAEIIDLKIEDGTSNLDKKFVQLIVELISLNKRLKLNIETLVLQVEQENAQIVLQNNIIINLGSLENLNARLKKAKEIMEYSKEEYDSDYTLNLKYFESGKIYLNKNK